MTGASLPIAAVQPTGGRPAGSVAAGLPATAEDLQALVPGQVLEARVMAALADGRMRLITSQGLVDALMKAVPGAPPGAAASPTQGQVLWLKVESGGTVPVLSRLAQGQVSVPAGAPPGLANATAGMVAAPAAGVALSVVPRDQASARLAFGPLIAQAAGLQAGPAGLVPAAANLQQALRTDLDPGRVASGSAPVRIQDMSAALAALEPLLAQFPALRLPPDATPAALKGLLQMLGLAAGGGAAAGSPSVPPVVALLTQLRDRLGAISDPSRGATDIVAVTPLPPPARRLPLQGEVPHGASLAPDAPLADHLVEMSSRTEAALSRLGLHALAALPEAPGQAASLERHLEKNWHWSGDIPLAFGDQTGSAQIAIDRDDAASAGAEAAPRWIVSLSFALPDLGALDARISLRGEKVGVALWAAEPAARQIITPLVPVLEARLRQAGLDVSDVMLRAGRAPILAREHSSGSLFVDRRS